MWGGWTRGDGLKLLNQWSKASSRAVPPVCEGPANESAALLASGDQRKKKRGYWPMAGGYCPIGASRAHDLGGQLERLGEREVGVGRRESCGRNGRRRAREPGCVFPAAGEEGAYLFPPGLCPSGSGITPRRGPWRRNLGTPPVEPRAPEKVRPCSAAPTVRAEGAGIPVGFGVSERPAVVVGAGRKTGSASDPGSYRVRGRVPRGPAFPHAARLPGAADP